MNNLFARLAAGTGLLLALGSAEPLRAQQSAITNAQLSQKSGQLDKALASINQAIANDKTKDKPEAWFTRGDIYYTLLDPSPMSQKLYGKYAAALKPGEALQAATESYQKVLQLDGPAGRFGKQVPERMKNLYIIALNEGVEGYKAKDYDKAVSGFRTAALVNPQDTTALLYQAYALDAKQDAAGAKAAYNQLLTLDAYKTKPVPVGVYLRLLQLASQENNPAEAQRIVGEGLKAYPNNKTFLVEDLRLSMSAGGSAGGEAALDKINKAIAADPQNASLYAVRAGVYEKQKKNDLAQADYKKAVELDPKNFDSLFNLGIYEYNKAAELYTRTSKMDLKTYQLKGKPLEAEAKKHFEAAAPYFERALALQPSDAGTRQALTKIYSRLNRKADLDRITNMK